MANFWKTIFKPGGAERPAQAVESFKFTDKRVRKMLTSGHMVAGNDQEAFRALLRNRVSRAGVMAAGAGLLRSGEAGKGLASRWYPATLAKRLRLIAKHRSCFKFAGTDGIKLMQCYAADKTMAWFIDPHYPEAGGRLYGGDYFDHDDLFDYASELDKMGATPESCHHDIGLVKLVLQKFCQHSAVVEMMERRVMMC